MAPLAVMVLSLLEQCATDNVPTTAMEREGSISSIRKGMAACLEARPLASMLVLVVRLHACMPVRAAPHRA